MNRFMSPSILFDAGAGDGGGGGAGNSTGGGASGNAEGLTEDKVQDLINKALAGRDKRLHKQITESLTGEDSPIMSSIGELKESLTKVASNNTNTGKNNTGKTVDGGNNDQPDEETAKRLKILEDSNKKLSERLEKSETEKAEMTRKQIAVKRDELALKDLKAAGFDTRGEALLALLERQGIIGWQGDDGEVGKPIVMHEDQEIPLAKYLTDVYVKSKSGQLFMDASPHSGSGGTGGEGVNSASRLQDKNIDSMSDEEIAKEFNKQLS